MWEWLTQKVTEIVKYKYKSETIRSTTRDDVVQETMMYLFQNKEYAEKIYETKCVGAVYRVVINTIYRLQSADSTLDFRRYNLLSLIRKKCDEYDIEPVPKNAYRIAAIIWNTTEISDSTKMKACTISKIAELLKIDKECEHIIEVPFDDITESEMTRNQLM